MVADLVISSTLVPQRCLFPASSFLSPFLFYEEQGQRRKEKSDGGDEPALSTRTNRSRAPTTSSRADPAPPSTPRSRYAPGGSNSPIPRFARILKVSVVNICLPRHRIFVIGERLWRTSRILKGSVVNICLPHHRGFIIEERVKENSGGREKPSPWRGRWVRRTRMRGYEW